MFVITVPSLSGSCWALVKLSASKLSLICEKNENNIFIETLFCLSVLQKMWVQRFIQQNRLLYIQYTYIACKYKIISMSYRNQRASNELFSCFKVLVQSNFIFADILYCAYTTMLCVQKNCSI